jgi:hypothetical protein
MKVMASLGAFGSESDTYARMLTIGGRFTNGFTDLSNVTAITKGLLTISGGSTGVAGLTGAAAPILGGFEIDGLNGQPVVSWQMPVVSQWWEEHLAGPMTAAIPTGAADVVADVTTMTAPAVGIPLQAYRFTHGG